MVKSIFYALGALAAIVLVGGLIWGWQRATARSETPPADGSPHVVAENTHTATSTVESNRVVLTAAKKEAAKIQVGQVERLALQAQRTIAGRLDYDQDRHVAIKSACDGIITDIRVQPGDDVTAGQIVAVLSSPEVGMSRADVRTKLAAAKLAEARQLWQNAICDGVEELAKMVHEERTPQEIAAKLRDDSLGAFREKIISAYTRARLAKITAMNTREAASQGAIAATVQQQRESEVQSATAALESVLDQSLFEVRQLCKTATADLAQAERLVDISLQQLNTLLGPAAQPATREQFAEDDVESLSLVNLLSPIEGTVEERNLAVSERAVAGEAIFTVANVSQLWAVADVRERDWGAITVGVGEHVQIETPAIADRDFSGEVIRVGRRVDPATGAAPLIARLEAYDQRLRPGLFIRMTIPISAPRQVLCVPEQAVVVHDGQHFVFVAEDEFTFRRQDVEVGETQTGMTEIVEGLTAGQAIATSGVFQLKSELLLAGEGE
jgi:cobalt-zinc-cadmium efflux system membrane fusion protein